MKIPNHVAIIGDGNRRWAREQGKSELEGHNAGADNAVKIGKWLREAGVHTVTFWGFSTENWDRSEEEKNHLFMLYPRMIDKFLGEAIKEKIKIVHLGRKDRLPKNLINKLKEAEEKTKNFEKYVLNIALDHGGRDDIERAVGKIIKTIENRASKIGIEDRKRKIDDYLDTAGQKYANVDLMIRPGGDLRTSGYLMWQAAYAELYFTPKYLPELKKEDVMEALAEYARRERRFGK